MKKLLSLLSILTISGSAVPTTIAASPYQKEETIKNSEINYSQTNNLKNLNRVKRDFFSDIGNWVGTAVYDGSNWTVTAVKDGAVWSWTAVNNVGKKCFGTTRDTLDTSISMGATIGTAVITGAATGTATGSAFPVVGTVIGAGVGAIGAGIASCAPKVIG